MIELTVNGEARSLAPGTSVQALIGLLHLPAEGRGVAVAVEGEVVPRSAWPAHELRAGDAVEVLIAVQGG